MNIYKHLLKYIIAVCCIQVKPLLQVTNTEEKLNKKENELRQLMEQLTTLRAEHDSLQAEHQQLTSDKLLLTEQLRAEQDLSAETEEVLSSFCALPYTAEDLFFLLFCWIEDFAVSCDGVGW